MHDTAQRILLVGDSDRHLSTLFSRALPAAALRHATSIFDAIADLSNQPYTLVLAPAAAMQRRGEEAIATLRSIGGDSRLLLYGDVATEPLSRKLCQAGGDDYLISPVSAADLEKVLDGPVLRSDANLPTDADAEHVEEVTPDDAEAVSRRSEPDLRILDIAAISDFVFDALMSHPGDAMTCALRAINEALPSGAEARVMTAQSPAAPLSAGTMHFDSTIACPSSSDIAGTLRLTVPSALARRGQSTVDEMASLLAKAHVLQQRHNRLQKLAFTDELTNVFNGRYFKHFLARMLVEARKHRFPVTLFLFDIDNFKTYNDQFGHGVGDDILRQTASLMRRCVRDHDLVARISGDEFAVVFWEKQGPRIPRDGATGIPGRPPAEPQLILERFRRLLATESFTTLGPSGKGNLTISGGLAVFPYDAQDMNTLIEAADKALMFGAKRSGRNSITLVGGEADAPPVDGTISKTESST